MSDSHECQQCANARRDKLWAGYQADCKGCAARAPAVSPVFFESRQRGYLTEDYKAALAKAGLTHAEVKAASLAEGV